MWTEDLGSGDLGVALEGNESALQVVQTLLFGAQMEYVFQLSEFPIRRVLLTSEFATGEI